MSLFPRMSSFGPMRHEYGPFFSLFNDTFHELQRISDNLPTTGAFAPKFDVKEGADAYTLEGELPGINQKDLSIEFADAQTLTIKGRTEHVREEGARPPSEAKQVTDGQPGGEVSGAQEDAAADTARSASENTQEVTTTGPTEVARPEQKHTYWVSERSVGEFARSFNFPNRVDHDNVKASLKNGILSVVVPKLAKQSGARRIAIDAE